jgi:hypothetical protein
MRRTFYFGLAILLCLFANVSPATETLPLAGQWRFALDRTDVGEKESWFGKNLPDKIQLPGVLEAQGYGDKISINTPWVLSLYDHYWFLRQEYAAYTNAGTVKVPFLCQPPRHYLGAAWYQRDIEIPADWNGKRVVLFLERPKWKSTVWLDDKEIGSDISLCTPHEYDLGLVPPGKHHLTVRVDNRMILSYRPDAHSVSDSLDQAWNGIVGKMELRATPQVWIEDVQVFPDAKKSSAILKCKLNNSSGKPGQGRIELWYGVHPWVKAHLPPFVHKDISWNSNRSDFEIEIPLNAQALGDSAKIWDEFNPALYEINLSIIADGKAGDSKQIIFGLRDLRTDGTQFTLNGQPLYLRGTHFGGDFPLTGYPATDVESWKKIFQTCKNYGLNHMRFHSWCPPEAAFTAADELGFYLQVECGMWNTFEPGSDITRQLYDETERIIKYYGNHPSLILLSASNEPKGHWREVLPQWAEHFRAADPRRLYTTATGFTDKDSPGPIDQVDYSVTGRFGPERVRGETGWFGRDYSRALEGVNIPVIAHELGQWCAYPDFDVMKKFTGFMQPDNYEIFRDSADKHGVLKQNKEFAQASGKFQLACYKEEIEANLRTPGLAGFQLLDLHDYTGQGTALIGLLDPLWGDKGYASSDEFKQFCSTVVPLARLKQRVFTTADKFEVPVEIANFGPAALTNQTVPWRILDETGGGKASGLHMGQNIIPLGRSPLIKISDDFNTLGLTTPGKYTLAVFLQDTAISNTWTFWLYPETISDVTPTNVLMTSSPEAAKKALADGGKVLFTPRLADLSWWSPPLARVPIFWNALMGPTWSRMLGLWCDTNSPALATFPTDANCDWQWTEIIGKSRAINLGQLPRDLKPIVSAIDDWNRNYKLGVIFEARVGKGKLLVCSADLNAYPVGQQLRRSLLDYMAGDKPAPQTTNQADLFWRQFDQKPKDRFQPATEISFAQFDSLFFDNLVMRKLGATAAADGKPAGEILDGDPNTFWSSADSKGNSSKPPHEIVVTFPQPVAMNGLVLMPRQNHREHQGDIREYKLEASNDGTNWQTLAQSELASTFDPQTIPFAKTVTAKQLRFTALSGFGADKSASLAELAVIYAGPKLPENSDKLEYRHVRTASTDIDAGGDAPRAPATKQPKK